MNNDRNMLFGVLAVQLRKVTPVQLMDIAGAWAMDPSHALPERLVEAGVISKEDCDFVNDVVDRAIQSHDGDTSATLHSFGGDEQIRQSFAGSVIRTPDGGISCARGSEPDEQSERLDTVDEIPGRYTHLSEYSHGGMGRILLVHDQHLGRDIAMKELLPAPGDAKAEQPPTPVRQAMPMMARFLQEARITGQLEHPAIVPVYELGRRKDGTLYYTMKLVRGETLSEALKSCKSLDDRIKLLPHFLDLCQAMAYAHSLGVIHRDIKPANVMVGQFGETVVIDWGLAKSKGREDVHARGMEQTMLALRLGKGSDGVHTAYGEAMGTPTYMPPEQAEGNLNLVNERSDVYSLGAVLYEILTGRPPFSGDNVFDILKKVSAEQPASVSAIAPEAPPELIAICRRAMSKDVNDRYANARELAQEIERFLSGALVQGYRYGMRELLSRFVRKHKAILATASAAAILLLVGGVASYARIVQERNQAVEARQQAESARIAETEAREKAEMARQEMEQRAYQSSILLANSQIDNAASPVAVQTLSESPERLRHWEWGYLQAASREYLWATLKGHEYSILSLGFSPGGNRIVSAGPRKIIAWDVKTAQQLFVLYFENKSIINSQFDDAGRHILAVGIDPSTYDNSTVVVWDAEDGRQLCKFPVYSSLVTGKYVSPGETVHLSPDGALVTATDSDNNVIIRDAATGDELLSLNGHTAAVRRVRYSPDATRLVTSAWDNTIRVWDAHTGDELPPKFDGHERNTRHFLFFPDSAKILMQLGAMIKAWDINDGQVLFTTAFQGTLQDISADGKYFLAASDDKATIYDAETGTLLRVLEGHGLSVRTCAFSPDGKQVITADRNGMIKLWSTAAGREVMSIPAHTEFIPFAAFNQRGDMIASGGPDATVKLWDLSMQPSSIALKGHSAGVVNAWFNPDGTKVYSMAEDRTARTWDVETGVEEVSVNMPSPSTTYGYIWCPENEHLAVLSENTRVDIWNLHDQEKISSFHVEGRIRRFAFSHNFKQAAIISDSTAVIAIHDTESGEERHQLSRGDNYRVSALEYSPDMKMLAATWNGDLVIYDTQDYATIAMVENQDIDARRLIFSPDGQYIAISKTHNNPYAVTIRNVTSGAVVSILQGHGQRPGAISFSPDSKRVVTLDGQATRIWDTVSGNELLTLKGYERSVRSARFSPDGRKLVTTSDDMTCRIWNALHWKEEELPGAPAQDLDIRLEEANRKQSVRTTEIASATRTISQERLQWTVFQTLQIPDISEKISDGLDGFVLGNTDTPTPLYRLGLAPGDRIFTINDNEINSANDFTDALARVHASLASNQAAPLEITFERLGQRIQFIFEIKETRVEHHESEQLRALLLLAFDLAEANIPTDPDVWHSLNSEFARGQGEPENAVTLWLTEYARDEIVRNILDQLGLAEDGRLCSINGVMMNRLDVLVETLFDIKKKVESDEIDEVTIAVQRDEFTRDETTIILID